MNEPVQRSSRIPRLQEEIRQAGCATDRVGLRVLTASAGTMLVVLVAGLPSLAGVEPAWAALNLAATLVGIGFCSFFLGLKCSEGYAWLCRRELRRRLASLPAHEQAAVLLPLRATGSEAVREIIDPLVRQLPPGVREVTPARPPDGSGSEIATPEGESIFGTIA
jgi:hypothetical protein